MRAGSKQPESKSGSSLISRLAASTALMAVTVVLIAAFSFQAFHGDVVRHAFQSPLKEWSSMIAGRIAGNPEMAQAISANHQLAIIVSVPGNRFAFDAKGEAVDPDELLKQSDHLRKIEIVIANENYTFLLDKEPFSQEYGRILFGLFIFLLLTIALVYAVQLRLLRPLKWLREGVDAVSKGDFSTRVAVVRNDEIGQVATSFNLMTQRVEQMMDDRERLLADVSHELRSPMARIKVALELMPESEKREAIGMDIREMELLTTALLEREQIRNLTGQARERVANLEGHTSVVNLVSMAGEVVDEFQQSPPGVNLKVPASEVQAIGDAALFKVLIHNLVDNAVKFSLPDSQPVEVSLLQTGDDIQIIIADDGPGIPKQQADKIFEAFVKLNPARGHRAGYGLGLNLCQRIVQSLKGEIAITQRQPRGSCVTVTLPSL